MCPPLLNVKLNDRVLWADGDSSFDPSVLVDQIMTNTKLGQIYVNELTDEIKQYNSIVSEDQQITIKTDIRKLEHKWNIPAKYADMSVIEYVNNIFNSHCRKSEWTNEEMTARLQRMAQELSLYHKYGLLDVLRTIIYIINTLTEKQVVWGVGRGSSVASYVLYLIGVHDVDSFLYDLDINDFLHTT